MPEPNVLSPEKTKRKSRFEIIKAKTTGGIKWSFVVVSGINIATIVIAAINLGNCPVEPGIPKYMLALGIVGLITKILTIFKDVLIRRIKLAPIFSFMSTAELAVLIVGSYYVYREYKPDYEPLSPRYCNKTLYLFSFIYITILYCLLLLIALALSCFVLGLMVLAKYSPPEDSESGGAQQSKP